MVLDDFGLPDGIFSVTIVLKFSPGSSVRFVGRRGGDGRSFVLSPFGGFSLMETFVGSCAELLLSAAIFFAAPIELVRLNGFSWYDSPHVER